MSLSVPPGLSFAAGPGLPGRLLLIFRAAVRARKRNSMALRGRLFALENQNQWVCGEASANRAGRDLQYRKYK